LNTHQVRIHNVHGQAKNTNQQSWYFGSQVFSQP
jgi:hypothetical protein